MRNVVVVALAVWVVANAAHADVVSEMLAPVTVTGTREQTLLSETPSAVGIISRQAIEQNKIGRAHV